MSYPLVSIIIVNFCGRELLKQCLNSLSQTEYSNYEVIIVDNNSNDGSQEFLKKNYPDIQIISLNKNYGFSVPNNIAAKVARGKYLVFLNNDTTVTRNWLTELVNVLEQDKKIVIGQSLLLKSDGSVDSSGDFVDKWGSVYSDRVFPTNLRYILSARGACMIIRKDVFLELGGFDESYFASFEDVELGWKAWLWGYKAVVVPSSIVYHLGGQTIQRISKTIAFHSVKNSLTLRLTNLDFYDSLKSVFIITMIVLAGKLFGISLVKKMDQRFSLPDFRTLIRAGFWVVKNLPNIRKKRRLLNSRKMRTNQELIQMGLITSPNR